MSGEPLPEPRYPAKIAGARDALERIARLPRPLVFTNGVFDVLHRGHVTYLEQARGLGASLFVAVNSDESVRRLGKGEGRPLQPARRPHGRARRPGGGRPRRPFRR